MVERVAGMGRLGRGASRCSGSGLDRGRLWPLLLAGMLAGTPGASLAQTFVEQGPGPRTGPIYAVQSADAPPNGTESGAVQAILPDPALGPNTIFAASPNGGIWVTSNSGGSWTPLTDRQSSLSIASLGLDPTDPTGKTIIAGVGITDNGEYSQFNLDLGRGGAQTGLLYTTNGGATWSNLGGATLSGQSVIGVEARGSTILAATFEVQAATSNTAGYGLFRSTDGGATFSKVSGGSGLPNGAVTSLVADPSDPTRFYAAVKSSASNGSTSVYISNNTGANWSPVFTAANSNGLISSSDPTTITLAAGPNGSLAIAISDLAGKAKLAGVFLSANNGTSWNSIGAAPNVVPGGQAPVNLHIAIDPKNQNIVYLTGDAYETCGDTPPTSLCTVQAWRLAYNPGNNTSSATSLTAEGTAAQNFLDANTVHADSRAIAFDQSGNLILSSDGGIYLRTNPQGNGSWQGLNNNLAVFEPYAVAFDANSKRLGVAAQDNGVSLQSAPGSPVFNAINFGDGTNININDRTLPGSSAIYSTTANFSFFSRMIVNAQGQMVSPLPDPVSNPGGIAITCNGGQDCSVVTGAVFIDNSHQGSFSAPLTLNRINPSLIAIGGLNDVYTTQDSLTGTKGATSIDLTLTDLGATDGPSVITYGTVNDLRAIAVGAAVNGANAGGAGEVWFSTTNAAGSLGQLTNYAGDVPTGIVFDNRIQSRIFVADATDLYYTRNADAGAAATFTRLTANLPAGFVRPTSVEFISNNGVNALLVGGLNTPLTCTPAPNGCVISSTQSPITVADSNSSGMLSGWRAFGRGLPNALVYQMAYNSTADVLAVASIGRGGWLLYDVTSNFAQATVLQFGLADNNSNPDASLLTDGTVGTRPLIKYGAGTLTITGNATYTGSTTVNGGALEVDGSIISPVLVNSGATLTGQGTVESTSIASGGIFMPGGGTPGTSMQVNGSLALQSGAFYLVQLSSTTSSFASVTGSATLAGTVMANFTGGSDVAKHYTILTAAGGISGKFDASILFNLPSAFQPGLSYDANSVHLDLALNFAGAGPLNANQRNVGNALANFFNSNGSIPVAFGALTPAALSQVAGETAVGTQQTTFEAMLQFVGTMLDPFIDGRGDTPAPQPGAAPYAEDSGGASAYAGSRKPRPNSERDAYGMITKAVPRNNLFDPHWSVWAAGFGGSQTTDGNLTLGTSAVTSRVFGTAVGADYLLSPRTIAGFALAGGGTNYGVSGFGTGRSDLFQAGAFVRHTAGAAYVAGALAYGWQDVTTDRIVTAAGVDRLEARFNANAVTGRLEGGYRLVAPWVGGIGITPYAAGQFTTFSLPTYAEAVLSGANTFALAYGARSVTDSRSELGIRTDKSYALTNAILTLRGRAAWAHDFDPDRAIVPTFQTLPGASFVVNGAAPASDSALATASAEVKWINGWSAAASFDSEFSSVTRSYAGKGLLRYAW